MNLRKALVYTLFLCCAIVCAAQVPVTVSPIPQFQAFDASGRPLAFGCVFTYQSGTTNPLATYSDSTGVIPNPNPVILSASGSANIWIQSGQIYTFIVESAGGTDCSLGTVMYSVDGIGGGAPQTVTNVTSSTTPAFSVIAQIQLFKLTLTANAVSLPVTFVNVQAPALITFQITENATGGFTFTWPSNVTGGATIDTAANHTTSQTFVWNGSSILPVGTAFTSAGNVSVPGTVISSNTFSAAQTFSAGITVTGGATADSVNTPQVQSTGNGTAISVTAASGSSGNTAGGNLTANGGVGIGTGKGGDITISAGNAGASGTQGGAVTIQGGSNVGGAGTGPVQIPSNESVARVKAFYGTAQSVGNVGSLVGWGTGPSVTAATGTDTAMVITITSGTTASANPTAVVTFADGTWGPSKAPICTATRANNTSPNTGLFMIAGSSPTDVTIQFIGTPADATQYTVNLVCIGRQ